MPEPLDGLPAYTRTVRNKRLDFPDSGLILGNPRGTPC